MEIDDKLSFAPLSHMHSAKGFKLEKVSYRIVGIVYFRRKTFFGWTKWKKRWMELQNDKILFYKWDAKRGHYCRFKIVLNHPDKKYILNGVSCKDDMYTFTLQRDGRRILMIRTPDDTALSILYPELDDKVKKSYFNIL